MTESSDYHLGYAAAMYQARHDVELLWSTHCYAHGIDSLLERCKSLNVYFSDLEKEHLRIADNITTRPAPVVTLTDEQIDTVLDSRGNMLYVIADKRDRLHLFAREILRVAMLANKEQSNG